MTVTGVTFFILRNTLFLCHFSVLDAWYNFINSAGICIYFTLHGSTQQADYTVL